jgi:hypothetical protein
MTQLNGLAASLSALDAIHRNDRELAISTLEAQVRSGATVLYALLPELSDEDRRMVQDVLQDAEKYARSHNISIGQSTE